MPTADALARRSSAYLGKNVSTDWQVECAVSGRLQSFAGYGTLPRMERGLLRK